ncbi:MAG: hypothetical protein ACM3ZT_06320 [Bacillota bacterium]
MKYAALALLLSGCAAAPPWQPPTYHPTIAVVSVLNPASSLYPLGKTSYDDAPKPAGITFDVNRQIRDTLHADMAGTGRYAVVDMDVDPGIFAYSTYTQRAPSPLHPNSFFTLDPDLAKELVSQARGTGADFIVAAVDIRYQPVKCGKALACALSLAADVLLDDAGWGLHYANTPQCHSGASTYLNYYVFVIDTDSGDTVASFQSDNDRYIKDINIDHQDMAALSGAQRTQIGADLGDMVQKSVNAALVNLKLVPGEPSAAAPRTNPCLPGQEPAPVQPAAKPALNAP